LRTVGSPDHLFACWYPLVDGVSTAPAVPVSITTNPATTANDVAANDAAPTGGTTS